MDPEEILKGRLMNIEELDHQHYYLIQLMDEACTNASDYNKCLYILNVIYRELDVHFVTEGQLMNKVHYPNATIHIIEHVRILKNLKYVIENYVDCYYNITYIISVLVQAIVTHIDEYDLEFSKFLNGDR